MIIIGGLGSIRGSLMGAAFMVLLPEIMDTLTRMLSEHPLTKLFLCLVQYRLLKKLLLGL